MFSETTNLCQLVKLPMLYTHFQEHRQRNHNCDISSFLSMHYWGQDLDDNDDDRDMQLPFKKCDIHAPLFLFVQHSKTIAPRPAYSPLRNNFGFDHDDAYYNPALEALFRPPRA